ncbi:peptide deformylase 1A, chloroplastic/mitochondrial isoform X1 [Carya illinoinensis]|uniref:Peptide deformylase n=1 Tax=Carya illinoinensis TaxID=32201 RepID=A0A8T1RTS6_CARIL|nr:peptide deformylase 1A, chloroplastic/mitochondrial isoform X1 [Carya illinoinensis]KAG6669452.1 hypothetical protein CIPAW_01G245300 [Carya illinoinensis]
METLLRLRPISIADKFLNPATKTPVFRSIRTPVLAPGFTYPKSPFNTAFTTRKPYSASSTSITRAGWLLGLGEKKKTSLPEIVKSGDPVLHEPAREVEIEEIGSERIQKIIDDMVKAMRTAPGVGLAAPQIGIPLRIIVLEDTKEYISYAPKEETKAQDRRPFDLLVILNPKLKKKSNRTALFFEGCLRPLRGQESNIKSQARNKGETAQHSVDGFRAVVERYLDVEVAGLDRYGQPIEIDASGWQARILQHECDHLEGTLYVDKMISKTFRTVENLDLPLADGCPKLGVR